MSECIHGLGPVEACTICNGRDKAERRKRRVIAHQWPALYDGRCRVCAEQFVVGEAIGRNTDGEIVCSSCAIFGGEA